MLLFALSMNTTGNRIRRLRKHEGLTLDQLAAELGVARSTMCRYELGDRKLPLHHMRTLVRVFEVSADYLLGSAEDNPRRAA